MIRQLVQAVAVVAVAAAQIAQPKRHIAGLVQHIAQRAVAAGGFGGAVIQRPALRCGGEVVQEIVFALQVGQIGDKALRTVNAGGGGFVAVVVPQFQPDIAIAFVVHHGALRALHRLHGGVGDQVAGGGAEHLQLAVLVVKGDGVTHDTGSIQRRHLTGNKVVQVIAKVAARAPCDHIAREIAAGLVVEGADEGAVHGGEVPQLIAAIGGGKARCAIAAGLGKTGEALAGGGVVKQLVHRCAVGMVSVKLHPVG